MNKCVTCIFYKASISTSTISKSINCNLNLNLNICMKYNVYTDICRLDKYKCGPTAKHYISLPSKMNKIKIIIPFYI